MVRLPPPPHTIKEYFTPMLLGLRKLALPPEKLGKEQVIFINECAILIQQPYHIIRLKVRPGVYIMQNAMMEGREGWPLGKKWKI